MNIFSFKGFTMLLSTLCCGAAPVWAEGLESDNDASLIHHVIAPFHAPPPPLISEEAQKIQAAIAPAPITALELAVADTSAKLPKLVSSGLGWRKDESSHDWMLRLNASTAVRQLDHLLHEAGRAAQVDPLLLKALIAVESSYMPSAVSPRGALGLMQIMPGTADFYATASERQRPAAERMIEPRTNILTGARILADLLRRFQRIDHALAAWNAGEAAVRKSGGLPPIHQTERHVTKVIELYSALVRHQSASRGGNDEQ